MAGLTGLFRRGASYYLKVVLPLDHPGRNQYLSGRRVVSLGPVAHREAVRAGTQRRAEILHIDGVLQGRPTFVAAAIITAQPGVPTFTLREVYDRWRGAKSRTADTLSACSRALSLFEKQAGNIPVGTITRLMGNDFREWLLEPDRMTTTKTARDRFTWIKSLLKYAHREMGVLPESPWVGLDIEARTTTQRRPWGVNEIAVLLAQPLFQQRRYPKVWNSGREAAYWLPLLGMFTGARLSELAQLTPADVRDECGILILDLNDEDSGKRIKSKAGTRVVPIHPQLLRLGFREYAMSVVGQESLWPYLPKRPGRAGGFFSTWFSGYRRRLGLAGYDFHCFRHTVRSALAQAGIRDDVIDTLLGHEQGGSTGNRVYTHRPLKVLQDAIDTLNYPALRLLRSPH